MRQRSTVKAMITLVAIGLSATSLGYVAGRAPRGGARVTAIDALAVGMGVGLLVGTIASVIVVWASRRSRDPLVCRGISRGVWAASTVSFVLVLSISGGEPPATFPGLAALAGVWTMGCCAALAAAWVGAVVVPEHWAARSDLLPEASSALLRAWPSVATEDRDDRRPPGVPTGAA